MKTLFTALVLLTSVNAFSNQMPVKMTTSEDKEMKVVVRDYSFTLVCGLDQIDEGVRGTPVMETYTTCDTKAAGEKIRSDFAVILKIEGADVFSETLVKTNYVKGDHMGRNFNLRVTGVVAK